MFSKDLVLVSIIATLFAVIVFRKYIFSGNYPIPGDILTGLYFPWLDYNWGYVTPVPVKNSLPSDIVSILYPWRILGVRILKSGAFPLWDPTILLGTPLLANFQSALLNPLNILFFIFGEIDAWSIQVVLQPILITITSYLFFRKLKIRKFPSIFGGLLFAYSGYSITWMEYNTINYTLVFLPLILLETINLSEKVNVRSLLLVSIYTALAILSGYPLNVIYILTFSFAYFLYLNLINESFKIKKVAVYFFSVLFGLLLSSIQLLPSIELYKNSIWNFDKVAQAGAIKYLPLAHLVSFFVSDFYGNPGTWNYWSVGSFDNFAFAVASVGVFFILVFITTKEIVSKKYLFFILTFFISLIYVTENPISRVLSEVLPSSVNTRALFLISFCSSILAARGLEMFINEKLILWRKLLPVVAYLLLTLITAIVFWKLSVIYELNLKEVFLRKTEVSVKEIQNLIISLRNIAVPLASILAVFILSLVKSKSIKTTGVFALLLVVIVRSADKYLSFTPGHLIYPSTEVIEFLKTDSSNSRFEKEKGNLLFPANFWSLYLLSTATGQNSSTLLSTSRYLSLINYGSIKDELSSRYNQIENIHSPLINTLNISHYLVINWDKQASPSPSGKPMEWLIPKNFKEVANKETVRIYENPDNLGLFWFADKVICESDISKVVKTLTSKEYDPSKLVFFNCPMNENKNDNNGSAKLVNKSWNSFTLRTKTPKESYVSLSSAYSPGWIFRVDNGIDMPVYSANIALVGVKVPEGEHTIEVYYKPNTFKLGLIITALSLVIWMIILFVSSSRKYKVFRPQGQAF